MRQEQPLTIGTLGGGLPAILHPGSEGAKFGVLIVVGGPQYRVGSHRQFVQLARALACENINVLRFDATGMGDAAGEKKSFDCLDSDIKTALDRFFDVCPAMEGVVLWGLCDGASAALLYGAAGDKRVCGMVLVNPWLENAQAQARTQLYDYYWRRLLSFSFWQKLLFGGVELLDSVKGLGRAVKGATTVNKAQANTDSYQKRMLEAFKRFDHPLCWVLSGNDLTASEFLRQYQGSTDWVNAAAGKTVQMVHLKEADHTFSNNDWKSWLAARTLTFIRGLDAKDD